MERWRWMPRDLGERYLLVNIPAYRLEVLESGKSVLSMRVVVGHLHIGEDPYGYDKKQLAAAVE